MGESEIILRMEDVTIAASRTPNKPVLGGINWEVRQEEYWIIGALPGSGKSDLLSTAAGLQKPLQGNVRLFDRDIPQLREDDLVEARLPAGLVFEHGGRLFQHMTVFENVALPLRYHGNLYHSETIEEVNALLKMTGLEGVAGQTPAILARNLRQRVGLARALALKPKFLLLDNPLAGLDPRQSNWWLDFLRQLSEGTQTWGTAKLTLAVATDDLRPWTDQGNRFALIKDHRWIELGTHESLLRTEEPLVRELLAADFTNE